MLKRVSFLALIACVAFTSAAFAGGHYQLGSAWVTGEFGSYVIVDDAGNRVLCAAAVDGGDPKHAWINQDFGNDYTIRCDVNMLTWADAQDLSRAGIAGRIQPDGTAADGDHDRGVTLLFHDNLGNVQVLNDLRGWGPNTAFSWKTRTWYTFEMTFSGNSVSAKITNKSNPTDMVELPSWSFPDPQNRQNGFVGVTASTKAGLVAYYDNFEVVKDGQVVFSDDFEGTPAAPSAVGTSPFWIAGEAGYYVVSGGKLFAIASNAADPKHLWYAGELVGGGSISADVTMLSWDDPTHDHSRAGIAMHIKPNGSAPDGAHDRGINLLLHQELNQVQFLNDLRAWGPAQTLEWAVGTTYKFSMSSNGTTVSGSIGDFTLPDWVFPDPQNRANGYAGVTASTRAGQIASYDNVVIKNAAGQIVYEDDFETFYEPTSSEASNWSLFR
ncbi:MAG: hypothetical protein GC154_21015 [bacterium]|nr:hypothetical protein [bacterium]